MNTKKIIGINSLIFLSLLLLFEVGGQITYYLQQGEVLFFKKQISIYSYLEKHPYLIARLPPNKTILASATEDAILYEAGELPKNNKIQQAIQKGQLKKYTAYRDSTRWTGAKKIGEKQIKVAVLGGSTTFGYALSDEDTWPAILQKELGDQYYVKNYGLVGFSTAEALIQMVLQVNEFQADIILFYMGWNDIHFYHKPDFTSDRYAHGIRMNAILDGVIAARESTALTFLNSLYLFGLVKKPYIEMFMDSNATLYSEIDPRVDLAYSRNLKTLKALAFHQGAKVIFIPQLINDEHWYQKKPGTMNIWDPNIVPLSVPKLMLHMNEIMSNTCELVEKNCFFASEVTAATWGKSDFMDDGGHFTPPGARKFAKLLLQGVFVRF